MKPIIGITSNYDYRDAISGATHMGADTQDWDYLASDYVRSVQEAGGIPVIIPQCTNPESILDVLNCLDGLLMSGGCDVDPKRYGDRAKTYCGTLVPRRDEEELLLIKNAFEKKIPMLGICRGLQIMTAAFGGTLYQDLATEHGALEHFTIMYPRNEETHTVSLKADSHLRAVFGADTIGVNSFHHQGVKDVPKNAVVTATSPDGVVEALEFEGGHPYTLAVQWHPEMMFDSDQQKKLIKSFVDAAKK